MAAMAAKTMAAGKNESTAVQKNGLAVNSHFSVVQVRQTPRDRVKGFSMAIDKKIA
jgi:hypothetical protein